MHRLSRLFLLVLVTACGSRDAEVRLKSVTGGMQYGSRRGTLSVTDTDDGIRIHGRLEGLPPGRHGLYILTGDCDSNHFNPGGRTHGGLSDPESHAGDLGNIEIGEGGSATLDITTAKISLDDDDGVLDRALVVTLHPDDPTAQPDGGGGPNLACGRIEIPSA